MNDNNRRCSVYDVLANERTCPQMTVPNTKITYLQASIQVPFQSGTLAFLQCPFGEVSNGPTSSLCQDGFWNQQLSPCKSIQSGKACVPLPKIHDGQILYFQSSLFMQNAMGTTATLICDIGYTASGSSTTQCESSGTWKPQLGVCKNLALITCPDISVINGTISYGSLTTSKVGSIATLKCNFDAVPTGHSIVTCMPNGLWSAPMGKCIPIWSGNNPNEAFLQKCPPIKSVQNGSISYDAFRPRSKGTIAILFCDIGFTPVANAIILCQADGQWSDAFGRCDSLLSAMNRCPLLAVLNGQITYDPSVPRHVGTIAYLVCNPGFFVRIGPTTLMCQPDRAWNGTIRCNLGNCERLIEQANEQINKSNNETYVLHQTANSTDEYGFSNSM
ncbi:unnamed protein product [Anisakis simplex]|uniref:Sushi, von Willebrand factor type A, EGF and pentraxin domain-containing protein 1 n=1 Tax=Anisakis simplex TaxID=6269 RepID=A0A0M3JYJ7_ANISI|nr:unnamed protein product [Anisakis simplex]